jgi:endo-1,4-beta-xylanase
MRSPLGSTFRILAGAIPMFLFACGRSTPALIQSTGTMAGTMGSTGEIGGTPDTTSQPAAGDALASGGTRAGGTWGNGGAIRSGGEIATSGKSAIAGATGGLATGGSVAGGKVGSGGSTLMGGTILGTSGTGGTTGSGGAIVTGGNAVGGTTASGGSLATGGGTGSGGAVAPGGSSGLGGTSGTGALAGAVAFPPKFFGNIDTRGSIRSDFVSYWDQFTPENAGKWGSVQGVSPSTFNWASLDTMYKYCEDHNIIFKEHCFIWAPGQPSWINNNNAAEVAQAWMKAFCERYPKTRIIDVVNEPLHSIPTYRDGLGGKGTTGFDWIINSFKWAHEACPNAILLVNDYNILEYASEHSKIIELVKAILAAGAPIMAVGAQGHDLHKVPLKTVQSYLAEIISQTGLPVYITEMDFGISDDVKHATTMKDLVTMFWGDPMVPGITYWGYIVGYTWRSDTGLMTSDGVMRPSMTWLMDFLHR